MAQYQVRGPDGQVHVFGGPDGATPDQVVAAAQQFFGAAHQRAAADTAAWQQTVNPVDGMSTLDRLRAGAGKALIDIARGAGQLVGAVDRGDVAQSRAQDAPLMATTAGKVGNFVGAAVPAAATALIPGANSITGGAVVGAGMGLLQPSTSTGETVANIGMGGVAGAAVPAAVKGLQIAKAAAEPFYEAGKNAIVGRALNKAAGQDAPAVAQRLEAAAAPFVGPSQGVQRTVMGELVPGSVPTTGQAAENAGVAALERAAAAGNPEVTNAVAQTAQVQNAARTGLLDELAGADGRRDFFDAARKATADQQYGAARAAGVDQQMAQALQPQITSLLRRPSMQQAQTVAKQLAAENDQSISNFGSVEGLDWLKKALDNQISKAGMPGSGIGNAELRALQQTKADLMATLEQIAPAYKTANDTFAAMSKPITQMDVASAIAGKAVDPLTGTLRPASYARALNDKTVAKVTGIPSSTLENTLEPAQRNAMESILLDLQRSNAAQNAGRGAGSDTVQKLAYNNILEQAGVPTVLRAFAPAQIVGNLAARGADAAYGRANRELSNRLAEVMLDPGQAARLMATATPAEQNQMLKLLARAASVPALAAPAAANAQKQQ